MSYYIQAEDVTYILDAHEDIETTFTANLTSHPTARRLNSTDNVFSELPSASFTGEITDVKSFNSNSQMTSSDYVDGLEKVIQARKPVKFKRKLHAAAEDNWFVVSFSPSQSQGKGYSGVKEDGTIVQTFKVTINLQQALPSRGAVGVVDVPKAYIDGLQVKGTGSSATKQFEEEQVDTRSRSEILEAEAQQYKANAINLLTVEEEEQ